MRNDAGITLTELSHVVGVHRSHLARVEAASARPSVQVLTAIGLALGADLSLRYFPGSGPRLHDRFQAAMIERFLRAIDGRWSVELEVPISQPSRGVIDVVLTDRGSTAVVAAEAQITDPAARTADPLECREGSGPGSAPPARRRRPGRGPGFQAAHPSIDCCESGDRPNVWIDTRGRVPSSNRCRRPGAYLAEQAMAGSRHRVDARRWATNLADALPAPRRRPGSLTSPVLRRRDCQTTGGNRIGGTCLHRALPRVTRALAPPGAPSRTFSECGVDCGSRLMARTSGRSARRHL